MEHIGTFTRLLATALAGASLMLASPAYAAQDIAAGGAFSCDFQVRGDTPLNSIPPMLKRDRMYMAATACVRSAAVRTRRTALATACRPAGTESRTQAKPRPTARE
jgi:hypothetical protein